MTEKTEYREKLNETLIKRRADEGVYSEFLIKKLDETIIPFYYWKYNPPKCKNFLAHKFERKTFELSEDSHQKAMDFWRMSAKSLGLGSSINKILLELDADMRRTNLSFYELIEQMEAPIERSDVLAFKSKVEAIA